MLSTAFKWIHRLENTLLTLLLTGMIVLAATQILLRNAFDSGLDWADPLLRIMVLWLGLLGAMVASRENKQISIDVFARLLKGRAHSGVQLLSQAFASAVSLVIAWHGLRLVQMEFEDQTTVFNSLPVWWFESIIPLAFLIIGLRYGLHAFSAFLKLTANQASGDKP